MKLTKDEIGRVVVKIVQEWKNQHAVIFSGDETRLKNLLTQAFQTELEKEDTLHLEVEKMLAKFESKFQSGELDRNKMFHMIKAQLAKEMKIIL